MVAGVVVYWCLNLSIGNWIGIDDNKIMW